MRRFMDSIFRGITEFINKNLHIKLKTNFTGTNRDNKNFSIRVLNHSGVESNNGVLLQKYNGDLFVSSIGLIDWDTGDITHYTKNKFQLIELGSPSPPTPTKGGLYFNTNTNKFYKCEDGATWVIANI